MKAERIATVVAALVIAAVAGGPALATPDPTTGSRGSQQRATVVVTPTAAVAEPAADAFDWRDAAVGAGCALGIVVLAGATIRLMRPQPDHEPVAN